MPRSPTSSEDEMAQSFSDYSMESESDSSKEETIYETIKATSERPTSKMEDTQNNTLVIRVVIPDLQQTVSDHMGPQSLAAAFLPVLNMWLWPQAKHLCLWAV